MLSSCQSAKPLPATASVPAVLVPLPSRPLWQSMAYTVYSDRVVQGPYQAQALSATALTSSYRSPANAFLSPQVAFKFSINGKDNELAPG